MKNVLSVFVFTLVLLSPFISEAATETVRIYAGAGDGYTMARNYHNDWDEIHDRSTALGEGLATEGAFYTGDNDIYVQTSRYFVFNDWNYVVVRPFIPFDTSVIPDDAVVENATLNLYPGNWRDGDTTIYVVETSQASVDSVLVEDFDQAGSVDDPIEGGAFMNNVADGQYAEIPLNPTGISWISKDGWTKLGLRTSDDAHDDIPSANNGIAFRSSEYIGTSTDPYLEVTYTTGPQNDYLLYTQVESPYPSASATAAWADEVFANGNGQYGDYPCGLTIGQCGCVITSLLMSARNAGLETDILGDDVNPSNFNNYLESVKGYSSTGALRWLAGSAYFGNLNEDGDIESRLASAPDRPFVPASTTSFVNSSLSDSKNAVLAYKNGHFVWLPEKTEDSYLVRDPWWYNTITADDQKDIAENVQDYNNNFTDARVLKISDEPVVLSDSGIELHLQGTAELLYTSIAGEQVGYVEGSIVIDLENASYGNTEVIGLSGVPEGATAGKHLLVYEAGKEFTIDVVGTETGEFTLEFYTIDQKGNVTTYDLSGETLPGLKTTFIFNLETGEVTEKEITYDEFVSVLNSALVGASKQQKKFFQRWAQKMFDTMENKSTSQALQSMEVFKKLIIAKKVDSLPLLSVLDRLQNGLIK